MIRSAPMTDTRIAVIFLGVICILCVGGAILLANNDRVLPEFIVATGGAAVGGVVGVVGGRQVGRGEVISEMRSLDDPPPQ